MITAGIPTMAGICIPLPTGSLVHSERRLGGGVGVSVALRIERRQLGAKVS